MNDASRPFLRLEDLLLPEPLPAVMALLLVLGAWRLSGVLWAWLRRRVPRHSVNVVRGPWQGWHALSQRRACRDPAVAAPFQGVPPLPGTPLLRGASGQVTQSRSSDLLERAGLFVVCLGVLAALLHAWAMVGWLRLGPLRVLGWSLAAVGLLAAAGLRGNWRGPAWKHWRRLSLLARGGAVCALVALLGLCAAALGPPTDVDSLDYHLGVPLDWLRHEGASPRDDWLHARLAGLGESLNLLGLAAGTDRFGSILQAAGLLLAVLAVTSGARGARDWVFGLVAVAACPLLAQLVPNQKAQLFPAAATTLGMVLVCGPRPVEPFRVVLALGCAGFAAGCKYTFLVTGACVAGLAAAAAARAGHWRALGAGVLLAAVIGSPPYLRNLAHHDDPLSPFLESWKAAPDPVVLAFADSLRHPAWPGLSGLFARAARIVVPRHPGFATAVLGIGALSFLMTFRDPRSTRSLVLLAGGSAVALAALGAWTARFFLEPYLWSVRGVVASRWRLGKQAIFLLLVGQSIFMAGVGTYGAWSILPGALSLGWRERVMERSASGYAAARWMDQVLPAEAVIATDLRVNAVLPRRSVASDLARYLDLTELAPQAHSRRLIERLHAGKVTRLVLTLPVADGPYAAISDRLEPVGEERSFTWATRNPWNRGRPFRVGVYRWKHGP